jgi:hypothetical protein
LDGLVEKFSSTKKTDFIFQQQQLHHEKFAIEYFRNDSIAANELCIELFRSFPTSIIGFVAWRYVQIP